MANRAQAKGTQYILSSPVQNIEVGDDRVRVEATHQEERSSFEARVVVIATGFGSKLIEGLGLGKSGDFVMGVQAEVSAIEVDEVEVYLGQEIAPGFFAWLVPTSPHRALVGLLSRRSPGLYLRRFMSSLATRGKIVSDEAELSYGGIPLKPLAKTYAERLIVVGDAAGQVKPTTGGGIYYGLLCADIAANILHRALASNTLSAKSLADYEREWRRKLRQELRIGYQARKFYERLSDGQIDRIFDIIKSQGIDEALLKAEEMSFDWHGAVVLRLLEHRAISKAIEMMKIPFHVGRGSKG
jgi:flavin-dependent dehydrogenase